MYTFLKLMLLQKNRMKSGAVWSIVQYLVNWNSNIVCRQVLSGAFYCCFQGKTLGGKKNTCQHFVIEQIRIKFKIKRRNKGLAPWRSATGGRSLFLWHLEKTSLWVRLNSSWTHSWCVCILPGTSLTHTRRTAATSVREYPPGSSSPPPGSRVRAD